MNLKLSVRNFGIVLFTVFLLAPCHDPVADIFTENDVTALREEAAGNRRFAKDRIDKAAQWREMAETARAEAVSAKRPDEQRRQLRNALEYEDRAAVLEAEANRLVRSAEDKERQAEQMAQQLDENQRSEARKQAEIEAQLEALREKDREARSREPPYRLTLDEVIGVWRFKESNDPFVIVPQDPESEAYRFRLEAHSKERVWKGEYTGLPLDHPGRTQAAGMVFDYTPKAEEMNPTVPIWVRREVEGELKWRLELDEAGDEDEPRLSLKWYPGEIEWKEDGGNRSASVIGEGEPREFELEPDYALDIQDLANAGLRVTLGGDHDPDANPIQSLIKGQPFYVKVSLPPKLAKEQGNSLRVTLRGLKGGEETTLELNAAGGAGPTRPVIYSHSEAVTIADCDVFTNIPREPQFLSLLWIFGESGPCLDLDVENNELVEFRYGESYQQIQIFNTWVQSGLERHRQGGERLKMVVGPVLTGEYTRNQKEAAHRRMRMLANYQLMMTGDALTDLHKFHLGELYLGDTAGSAGIVMMTDGELSALAENRSRPSRSTDPDYFNPMVKAYLEGLSGKNLDPKAHLVADEIFFTSEQERQLVRMTLMQVSKGLQSKAVRTAAKEFSFGMYEGLVSATPAGSLYLIATGRDHFNRKVPTWMRVITAIGLASDAVLTFSNSRMARAYLGKPVKRMVLGGSAEGRTLLFGSRSGGVRSVGEMQGAAGLPASLNEKKRQGVFLSLDRDPPGSGGMDCGLRAKKEPKPRTLLHPGGNVAAGDMDIDFLEQLHTEDYARNVYGQFEFVDDGPKLFDLQSYDRPTCNMMAANYSVWKRTGRRITEEEGHRIIMGHMIDDYLNNKITPDEFLYSGAGVSHGYSQGRLRTYLRSLGAKVAEVNSGNNGRVKLRHIWSALEKGWDVKVVIKIPGGGMHNYHAVIVEGLTVNSKTGAITKVRVYDPNIGRLIDVPANHFKNMIATSDPMGYGIMTVFKWDD